MRHQWDYDLRIPIKESLFFFGQMKEKKHIVFLSILAKRINPYKGFYI